MVALLRQAADAEREAGECAARSDRVEKIRECLTALPNATWRGTRSALAKRVGGKNTVTMAAIGDLISTGRAVEVMKGNSTETIRWAG